MALIATKAERKASGLGVDAALRRLKGAGVYAIPPDTRFRKHEHETAHLCAVLRGEFRERIVSRDTILTTGSLRVSPSSHHHIDFGPNGAYCLVIEIDDDDVARAITHTCRRSAVFRDPALFAIARTMAAELEATSPTTALIVECHVAEVVAQIGRRTRRRAAPVPPAWLREARDHLVESLDHASLANIARERDVHIVHLARAFREHFGLTIGGFVRRQRVIAASNLMGNPDLPLSRIAHEAGFADQSHMTREFRLSLGTTPARWRAKTF